MDKLYMLVWITIVYALMISVVLTYLGFAFPIVLLGYVPWLVGMSLIIQRDAYD